MTAPLRQKIRCLMGGHDWRQAIDPRDGPYRRCRRCWEVNEADAIAACAPTEATRYGAHHERTNLEHLPGG